jgi:hypothetical protein
MKTTAILLAVWVLAVPCAVAVSLIFAFLAHSAYGIAVFLALLLAAAAALPAIVHLPLLLHSSLRRRPAVLKPNHFQEKTHANCFDSQLDS